MRPTFEAFIKVWITVIKKVAVSNDRHRYQMRSYLFRNALSALQSNRSFLPGKLLVTRPESMSPERDKKRRRLDKKQDLAEQAPFVLNQLEQQGCVVAWTDGSAGQDGMGGGIRSHHSWGMANQCIPHI